MSQPKQIYKHPHKIPIMELAQEYAEKYPEMLIYLEDLKQIILEHIPETEFEGNSFYHHQSIREYPELYNKQLNSYYYRIWHINRNLYFRKFFCNLER